MNSWSSVYFPPALPGTVHKPLKIVDSYSESPIPIEGDEVTSYICGITPYDATHLGHAATYLTFDLVHRYLIASGKRLNFTENITDIDDPLLERAKRDAQDWQELAHSQVALFKDDMTALRVIPPNNYLGVVESMEIITDKISELVDTGICYELEGDYYLSIGEVEGALENLPCELKEAISTFSQRGGDPDRIGKRHPLDTLIWLRQRPNEPSWSSEIGMGRPGWHIECVAIALSTLDSNQATSSITLQGGGSDLRFPHHYMTAVQARAMTGKPFAAVYAHSGMIEWQGEKMSKSKGNLVFVSKLLKSGWLGEEIRLALINRDYAKDFAWDEKYLHEARGFLYRIGAALSREDVAPTSYYVQEMVDSLASNLDIPRALASVAKWCEATERGETGGTSGEISRALDLYLGIAF